MNSARKKIILEDFDIKVDKLKQTNRISKKFELQIRNISPISGTLKQSGTIFIYMKHMKFTELKIG